MTENRAYPWTPIQFAFIFSMWGISFTVIQMIYSKIEDALGSYGCCNSIEILKFNLISFMFVIIKVNHLIY